MAFELFPESYGAILRATLEDGYDSTSAAINAATDVHRCPMDATFDSFQRSFIDRSTQAAFISGVRSSAGVAEGAFAIDVILDHQTINNPTLATENSIAGVPKCDLWLRAGGWVASHTNNTDYPGTKIKPDGVTLAGNSTDQILTYTYKPRSTGQAFSSARIEYDEVSELGTEGLRHRLTGARLGWSLNFGTGGEHWVYSATGRSKATTPVKITPTTGSAFDDNDAIVALGGNYSITKFVSTAKTFGKASETAAASTLAAYCSSMELTSNLEVQALQDSSGSYGVSQIRYTAGRPQLKMVIDQVVWNDDFDLYGFMNDGHAIRVSHAIPQPNSTPTSFVVFEGTFQITGIEKGAGETGYRNATITLDYLYPQNSTDVAGLVPTTGITLKWVTTV
jgi:hypothetical protein